MVEVPNDTDRPSVAERHLGLIATVAGVAGLVAICGSPWAVWDYMSDLVGTVWSAAAALLG